MNQTKHEVHKNKENVTEENHSDEILECFNASGPIIKDRVYDYLLNGRDIPNWQKNDIFYKYDIDLHEGQVMAAILEITDKDAGMDMKKRLEEKKAVLKSIKEKIYHCIEKCEFIRFHTVIGDLGVMKIIMQPGSTCQDNMFYNRTTEFFECLIREIRRNFNVKITIGVGNIYGELAEVCLSYFEAKDALGHKYLLGENRAIYYNQYTYSFNYRFIISQEKEQQLTSCIINGNSEYYRVIGDIFNEIYKSGRTDFCSIFTALNYLLANVTKQLGSKYLSLNKICNFSEFTGMNFSECSNITEMKNAFISKVSGLLQMISEYYLVHKNVMVRNVCEYVLQNVDSNITLKAISDQFFISINYFSYLFKEQTGENFQGYLSRVKMERAKMLLKNSSYKAYEVGNMLGYHEPAYFSKLFRKYAGCTPTEYRNMPNESYQT